MLQMKTDKLLEDAFHSKNIENAREREYLKMHARHITKNIVEGEIPGNLGGESSGRLGGFHLLPDNNIVLIYSRIECENMVLVIKMMLMIIFFNLLIMI